MIRTFFISHADATELAQILNGIIRIPALAVAPQIVANKTNNTITVRASANIVAIIERIIEQNDNPRAEVVIDVQILEVNRARAKQFGIDLVAVRASTRCSRRKRTRAAPADGVDDADAAAVQPEHDHARHLDRRLLPVGAVGRRAVPGDRLADAADRQAAAARRRRAEDHARTSATRFRCRRPCSRRSRRAARTSTR